MCFKSLRNAFVCCVLLVVASCASNGVDECSVALSSKWQGRGQCIADTSIFKNCLAVNLETKDKNYISHVDKILLVDGRLFLFDRHNEIIQVFDKRGKFLRTIDRRGHGSGEYLRIFNVTYDRYKKQIMALVDPCALMFFDKDGSYIGVEKLDSYYTDISADKDYIYLYNETYANAVEPDYTIKAINKVDGSIRDLLPFGKEFAPFCRFGSKMTNVGYFSLLTRKFDYNIYVIKNGELTSKYELDLGDMQFPSSKLNKVYPCEELFSLCYKNNFVYSCSNIVYAKNNLMFYTNLFGIGVLDFSKKSCRHYKYFTVTYFDLQLNKMTYIPVEGDKNGMCFLFRPDDLSVIKKMRSEHPEKCRNKVYVPSKNSDENPLALFYW